MNFRYRTIDFSHYPRKEHFEHFLQMANPFINMTVEVDLTDWLPRIKAAGYPFFLCFQYAVVRAANRIPAFRQRIRDDHIVEYEFCNPSYTVAIPDGTYRYCLVNADQPLKEYLLEGKDKQEQAMHEAHLQEEGDVQSLLFISCLPSQDFCSLSVPFPNNRFSIPCFTWGKYRSEKVLKLQAGQVVEQTRYTIPVAVCVHHALIDGSHIASFFSELEKELAGMLTD